MILGLLAIKFLLDFFEGLEASEFLLELFCLCPFFSGHMNFLDRFSESLMVQSEFLLETLLDCWRKGVRLEFVLEPSEFLLGFLLALRSEAKGISVEVVLEFSFV